MGSRTTESEAEGPSGCPPPWACYGWASEQLRLSGESRGWVLRAGFSVVLTALRGHRLRDSKSPGLLHCLSPCPDFHMCRALQA